MKYKKMIAVQAESYVEEQALLSRFPNAYWRPSDEGSGFAIFYVPEGHVMTLKEMEMRIERNKNKHETS
jgi:hypothetical protein